VQFQRIETLKRKFIMSEQELLALYIEMKALRATRNQMSQWIIDTRIMEMCKSLDDRADAIMHQLKEDGRVEVSDEDQRRFFCY